MIGSAALSLAHVASGIFDIYKEESIRLWDAAAGLAIVQAAGGSSNMVTDKENSVLNVIAASSSSVLLQEVSKVPKFSKN